MPEGKQTLPSDSSLELWVRGRLWEIFGFTNGDFTALELAAEYSRLVKLYKSSPKQKQILEDAFAILNAPLTRQFYEGCRMEMKRIRYEIGDNKFEQAASKIWADLWGWVSERWQPPPEELVCALIAKYRMKEEVRQIAKRRRNKWIIALTLAIIGVICLVVIVNMRTAPPPSPSESPVTSPSDLTNIIFEDDFSDPNSGWTEVSAETAALMCENGSYHVFVKEANWVVWGHNYNIGQLDDFVLEVDAKLLSLGDGNRYGIVFREQDTDNFYYFSISSGYGSYMIGKIYNGTWSALKDWADSSYIHKGTSTNRLKVICQGTQIEVYVNAHKLAAVKDYSFPKGYIGLAAESGLSSKADVLFDNLKIHNLD